MEEKTRVPSLDDFTPKTRLQFPDGAILTEGTKRDDDDQLVYGVHLVFASGATPKPGMDLLLPPHSVDILITILQNAANNARFIMGQKLVDYPAVPQAQGTKRKRAARKTS
jgi:hypothetical protein